MASDFTCNLFLLLEQVELMLRLRESRAAVPCGFGPRLAEDLFLRTCDGPFGLGAFFYVPHVSMSRIPHGREESFYQFGFG